MHAVSPAFLDALLGSHQARVRVDVTWQDGTTTRDLRVFGGEVRVDASAPIRRTLTLEVEDDPRWAQQVLAGATIRPYRGLLLGGALEMVPLGVFPVRAADIDLGGLGTTKITAPDRWRYVQRSRLYWPLASRPGETIAAEWGRLVVQAIPPFDGPFVNLSESTQVLAPTVWPRDRAKSADDLALSIGCEGFFDTLGQPTLRPIVAADAQPVWSVSLKAGGVILGGSLTPSDENTYSAVSVGSTRTDGSEPFDPQVYEDTNPLSPTYAFGSFGQVGRFFASPAITTPEQAMDAAMKLLPSVVGVSRPLTLRSIVNPALDAGDPIDVEQLDGTRERHVIDALTIPLSVRDPMPMVTRTLLAPLPDEGS